MTRVSSEDERVRQFIDGELDDAEEAALLAEAEHDPRLLAALEGASSVQEHLVALREEEPLPPPPDLVEKAARGAVARAEGRPSWLSWFLEPKTVRIRISPLTVAATALVLGVVGTAVLRDRPATVAERTGPIVDAVDAEERAERAPFEMLAEVPVRFVMPADGAESVAVAGDFNDWRTDVLLDDPDGDGVFATTVRVPPGTYTYMFVIDGERWVTDPNAALYRDDGFGNQNAVLRIQ